jgi:predicted Co/Zn/Cd cation transporter (cation efflux family)
MDATPEQGAPCRGILPGCSSETKRRNEEHIEQHILKFSVFFACFFAVLGVAWGVLARSQMIVFDGLYSLISVILSSLSIYTAWSLKIGDDARFPLGRSLMEPMVIALKSIVIVALCIAAFSRAVISLLAGGQEVNTFSAMFYALFATTACLGGLAYIIWKRKRARTSLLIKAECMQWGMDTMLSATVLLGFAAASIMQRMGYARYAVYVDPLMVIAASMFFVKMPFGSLVESIKDMLRMAPDGDIHGASSRMLEEIVKARGFDGFRLRISKSGRELTYKIGLVSEDPGKKRLLVEMDDIRREIQGRLQAMHDNPIWLGVSFVRDKKWG